MTDISRHPDPATRSTRRGFLAGVIAAGALAACSGSDSDSATPNTAAADAGSDDGEGDLDIAPNTGSSTADLATGTFTIVQRFPNNVQVPGVIRMPISLSTGAAQFIENGPATLGAQVIDFDGAPIGSRITAIKREVAPAAYYDFRSTIDTPGIYALVVDGGPATGAAFQVMEPADVPVPSPGELLPGFDTPTTGDDKGLSTICTRTPEPCPFHTLTLAEALNVGRPVAYYVGTPAFCSTGSCAPALEALIDTREEFGDTFVYVHAEVFTDDAGTQVAPAVGAVGMTFEPAVFITDAEGVVVERLDAVWDRTELEEALARAIA